MPVNLSLSLGRINPLATLVASLEATALVAAHLIEHVLALLLHEFARIAHIRTLIQIRMSILERLHKATRLISRLSLAHELLVLHFA
jgi:hypothetical protein